MFFEQNAQALLQGRAFHHRLIHTLQATEPLQDAECFETPNGHYTLKTNHIFLHDPENPVDECKELIKSHVRSGSEQLHLILGLGLGYLLDELYQASAGPVVVYEPNLPLLRFVLDNVDLSSILGSSRIWIVSSQFELLKITRKKLYAQYRLDVLALKGSAYLLANEIPRLMQQLTELELDRVHDFKTGQSFHFKWLEQFFQNMPYFSETQPAEQLFGQFKGKPALIISRGPSLDHSLEAIRELRDNVLLIVVGSAVRCLWQAGILPDFAVFYDANGMREQLHGIPAEALEQITFLLSPFTQTDCFVSPARHKFLFLAQNNAQFADWLDQALEHQHQRLEGGGTVSLIAFQAALAMRCDPVILVGQDLAFPNNQVYAGGIELQLDEDGAMALSPNETLYAEPETMDVVIGQSGESLPTLKAYKSFIRHFEDLAVQNAQSVEPVQLYNASIGGAKIEGYVLSPLAAFGDLKLSSALKHQPEQGVVFANWPGAEIQQRQQQFKQALVALKQALKTALTLSEVLYQTLSVKQADEQKVVMAIQSANRQWNQLMLESPFLAFMTMFELMSFRERINALNTPQELSTDGLKALLDLLSASAAIFKEKALEWVSEAERHFDKAMTGEPVVITPF